MFEEFIDFFNHPFFVIIGGISTLFLIIGALYTIMLIVRGVLPVWYRLGLGLTQRKIAIIANEQYESLFQLLSDSKVFNPKKIERIELKDVKKAKSINLILCHWEYIQNDLDKVLSIKRDSDALIVYAPNDGGRIDTESLVKINNERNAIVVNFRGRLLNDLIISMITTSYD